MFERPSFGLMREGPSETAGVERDEELAQRDMKERGRRLAAFKQATIGRVWWYGENGGAYLIADPHATVSPIPANDPRRRAIDRLARALSR